MKLLYATIALVSSLFILTGAYFFAMPIQKRVGAAINETAQGMDIDAGTKAKISNNVKTFNFQMTAVVVILAIGFVMWFWSYSQKVDYESVRI